MTPVLWPEPVIDRRAIYVAETPGSLTVKFFNQLLAEQQRLIFFESPNPSLMRKIDLCWKPLALCAIAYGLQLFQQTAVVEETYREIDQMLEAIDDKNKQSEIKAFSQQCRQGQWNERKYYQVAEDLSGTQRILEAVAMAQAGKWEAGVLEVIGLGHYYHATRAWGLLKIVQEAVGQGVVTSSSLRKL